MSDATFWGLGITTGITLGAIVCMIDELIRRRRFKRAGWRGRRFDRHADQALKIVDGDR